MGAPFPAFPRPTVRTVFIATATETVQTLRLDAAGQVLRAPAEQLDAETEGELRSLLDKREFTTLADWLSTLFVSISGPP